MREFAIGNRLVGGENPVFVIAEAGINHQGDINIAKQLIDIAVGSGADAVKFQRRTAHRMLTKAALDKAYTGHASFGPTYGTHRAALELSDEEYYDLKRHCDDRDVVFLASGWDEVSLAFLNELGMAAFKMASADLGSKQLLEQVGGYGKPIVISTGMSTMDDIRRAYDTVKAFTDDIAILQCTSTYPCEYEDINLRVIKTFRDTFDAVVGYSGHELGISVPVAAVAMGAKIVERHFTLDRTMKGGDHAASLEPTGLTKMIRDIRHVESAMGSSEKSVAEGEAPVKNKLAKSLISECAIPKGTVITREMLTAKSPGDGIPPWQMDEVIGREAARDIEEDVVVERDDIKW